MGEQKTSPIELKRAVYMKTVVEIYLMVTGCLLFDQTYGAGIKVTKQHWAIALAWPLIFLFIILIGLHVKFSHWRNRRKDSV